jgi:hypothetical protein
MNDGSGEWWLYGEDGDRFYAVPDQGSRAYVTFPRSRVPSCPGFQPRESRTWCGIDLDPRK